MSATKVTLLFNAVTKNPAAQAERSAGFSESYYSDLAIDSAQLAQNWTDLCNARAGLLATNVSIIGSRYQVVDPAGGSRQFDNNYPPGLTLPNDLPGVALQWTVRSAGTPNQRSLILRGVPDACVATGEYTPAAGMGGALTAFFAQLTAKWRFRAIDRTVLPLRIVDIVANLMTTADAHGLVVGNIVNIMSTFVGTDPGKPVTYRAYVRTVPNPSTATLIPLEHIPIPNSTGGKVRKVLIHYPLFSITVGEVQTPTAMYRKAGAPFKKFRGRRTVRH